MPETLKDLPIVGPALAVVGAFTLYLARRALNRNDADITKNEETIKSNRDLCTSEAGEIYKHVKDAIKGVVPRPEYEKVVEMTDSRLGRMEDGMDEIKDYLGKLSTNFAILAERRKKPRDEEGE